MSRMKIKQLRNHAKKLPCFTCIMRVPCGNVDNDEPVRDPCNKFVSWTGRRDTLTSKSLYGYSKWNDVMKIVVQEEKCKRTKLNGTFKGTKRSS